MLGKRIHAQTVFDWRMGVRGDGDGNPSRYDAPDGFKNLSGEAANGCGRDVYLHEDSSIVYKVDPYRRRSDLGNEQEYVVAWHLRRKYPNGIVSPYCRIPKVGMFSFRDYLGAPAAVVSMQFINGEQGGYSAGRGALLEIGLRDMHDGNYVTDEQGVCWPVDLGSRLRGVDTPY